jgi:hypothetical protein
MHQPLRHAGLLAALALLSLGCGHQAKPEMPEPSSQESTSSDTPYTPAPASAEQIP